MNLNRFENLFPSRFSLVIFVGYILLFVNQGILVTASQDNDNNYDYNIITVVLLTEVLKLFLSSIFYCQGNNPNSLVKEIGTHRKLLLLYFVPSLLYCFYNNLAFINLSKFDPTTYYLLLQLRVVVTGILFQIVFKKWLSRKQWISLMILTFGCMLKQINFNNSSNDPTSKSQSLVLSISSIFIFVQIFCSCFAGVYNEYLLKHQGENVNIFIQNVFMYLDSIICNLILLIINGSVAEVLVFENFVKVLNFKVIIVMINNAAVGIVTSFFLKSLNSILKTFASALELILTAVLSFVFFGIPIYLNTILAIATVMIAIFLYSANPVTNQSKTLTSKEPLVKLEEV